MAIEIDNNTVRYAIADVDTSTGKIYRRLDEGALSVGFYDDLTSGDDKLYSSATIKKARSIFLKLRSRKEHYSASKVRAIAIKTFREAHNAQTLADKLKQVAGIHLQILTAKEEDRLRFLSTLHTADKTGATIVWDIGNNALQLTSANPTTGPIKHNGDAGSFSFLSYLKEVVQSKPASTTPLLPISMQEISSGIRFSRYLAHKVPPSIKTALTQENARVVGIGPVFEDSLAAKTNGDERVITKASLYQLILKYEKINRHNNPPTTLDEPSLANAILMYGFMDALNIEMVEIPDHNSTVRMLELPHLWY